MLVEPAVLDMRPIRRNVQLIAMPEHAPVVALEPAFVAMPADALGE